MTFLAEEVVAFPVLTFSQILGIPVSLNGKGILARNARQMAYLVTNLATDNLVCTSVDDDGFVHARTVNQSGHTCTFSENEFGSYARVSFWLQETFELIQRELGLRSDSREQRDRCLGDCHKR
jgi:hypothetical protein